MSAKQLDSDAQLLHMEHSVQFNQLNSRELPFPNPVEQAAVKLGIEASQRWPQGRLARLANLRAQVEAGTYKVESNVLATRIMSNETHFFRVQIN
jgi:anti-sigma28 factor (negative regulator of flagellin synthesis)